MTKVIICSAAEIDYTESLVWYVEKGANVAKAFDDEFGRALAEIANTPKRFPFCDKRHQFT